LEHVPCSRLLSATTVVAEGLRGRAHRASGADAVEAAALANDVTAFQNKNRRIDAREICAALNAAQLVRHVSRHFVDGTLAHRLVLAEVVDDRHQRLVVAHHAVAQAAQGVKVVFADRLVCVAVLESAARGAVWRTLDAVRWLRQCTRARVRRRRLWRRLVLVRSGGATRGATVRLALTLLPARALVVRHRELVASRRQIRPAVGGVHPRHRELAFGHGCDEARGGATDR